MAKTEKYCAKCDTTRPVSEFYITDRDDSDGYVSICKLCRRAYAAAQRASREARINAAAYQRQYRKQNKDLHRKRREREGQKWLDTMAVCNQRRRARMKGAPGAGITRRQWQAMKEEYGGRCGYCGKVAKLTMDHMDPISRGGAHEIANIVPACRECNSSKCDRTILHWLVAQATTRGN